MNGGRTRVWLRPGFDPSTADQAEARRLDPDPRGNPDPDPPNQRHLSQGDLRGSQLCLAQIKPGAADNADDDHVAVHPPRPGDSEAADR